MQLEQKCSEMNIGPDAIFNMDEKGFMIGQVNKQQRIVPVSESRGENRAKAKVDGSREWVTLIACICADGTSVPPAIIFKGRNGNVCESWLTETVSDDNFFIASSERGWTNDQLGVNWLNNVFEPATNSKGLRRRLLIVMGTRATSIGSFVSGVSSCGLPY